MTSPFEEGPGHDLFHPWQRTARRRSHCERGWKDNGRVQACAPACNLGAPDTGRPPALCVLCTGLHWRYVRKSRGRAWLGGALSECTAQPPPQAHYARALPSSGSWQDPLCRKMWKLKPVNSSKRGLGIPPCSTFYILGIKIRNWN